MLRVILRVVKAVVFIAVVCTSAPALAQGNLVTNGGFESPGFEDADFHYLVGADSTLLTGWTCTYDNNQEATYVYYLTRYEATEGDYTVFLNDGDSLSTIVAVEEGVEYVFSFDHTVGDADFADTLVIDCAGASLTFSSSDGVPTGAFGSRGSPVYRYAHSFVAQASGAVSLTISNPQNRTDCFACGGVLIDTIMLVAACCPADFNCDGFINSDDIADFVNAYFAADPRADFNQDGFINSDDIADFINAYFAGC
jgi:hypothetical protein